jgi:hypothetical protein
VWSINPVFDPTAEFGTSVDQGQLDAAALLIANRTLPTTLRAAMSTAMLRTGCRLEVRNSVGDALLGISIQGSTTPSAGTGTPLMPPQSAMVVSIRTSTPGGRGRGRLYWPAMGAAINTSGRITTPVPATFIADFKTYLLGIRSDLATSFPLIGFDLAVRSVKGQATPHATRIQVGNVVDTQRRRRDSLPEAYSAVSFP